MKTRYAVDKIRFQRMTTAELRETFLVDQTFKPNQLSLLYWETERTVVGSAVPTKNPLKLEAGKELACEYFCQRREIGIMNLGKTGTITVDNTQYQLEYKDCLYIGRGSKEITFASKDPKQPAQFYILSYPAHTKYPTTLAKKADANPIKLGSKAESNQRTIFQYIHTNGIKSCQLVMGFTELEEGCIWNTMKPHTHERRTEVYTYFEVETNDVVFHMMGTPTETRHLIIKDKQSALSPSWSIHAGAGTRRYSFIWGMGGENQDFTDMDHVEIADLK